MRRMHLIRHAPTHAKTMVGWSDLPADCSDRAAFARLSAALPVGAMAVTSDLARAMATADALGLTPRLPPHPGLREMHFGVWELRSFAEIEAEDPDRLRAFWETPGEVAPPGGESWNALTARVRATLDGLLAQGTGDLIVVSHFGPILAMWAEAAGLTPDQAFAQRIDNLSLTEIGIGDRGWQALSVNRRL